MTSKNSSMARRDSMASLIINKMVVSTLSIFLLFFFLGGCAGLEGFNSFNGEFHKPNKNAEEYEKAGEWWGKKHWQQKLNPGDIDNVFVGELVNNNSLDFFWIHSDLKDAFVKGYRIGYQDRTADLVLGPNVTAAASLIGKMTGDRFVEVINAFEQGWATTLKRAIDVFITLISEGSQADREKFISQFIDIYSVKHAETQKMLKEGGFITQVSEGGTLLFIDYSRGKTLGALDIPNPTTLKTEIYHQAFRVMGDELGRRFSTNLIKRNDLIELLRRSKTALEEVTPGLNGNLRLIVESFRVSYGTDAENVFQGVASEAGYTISVIQEKPEPITVEKTEKLPKKKKK